ncbi:hypothetical protein ACFQPF_17230 [Fictibacillus iocasae]|uniref:Uncharacterized protein n=1 Tax=Fictibacillus iocasae TaxID=2715437 RepID=A0ABW2NU86_9BACL
MPNYTLLKFLLLAYLLYVGRSTMIQAFEGMSITFVVCWLLLAALFAAGQFSVRAKKPVIKVVQRSQNIQGGIREITGG